MFETIAIAVDIDVSGQATGCTPLASFSMSSEGRVWLDQNKQYHTGSSSNRADTDSSSFTNVYSKFISRFLPEQPEQGMDDGSLLPKPLTNPPPPGDMSTAVHACTLYFVFTQLPSLDPDKVEDSVNDDDRDTAAPAVVGDIVTDHNHRNSTKKLPKDISLQPLADMDRIRALGSQVRSTSLRGRKSLILPRP